MKKLSVLCAFCFILSSFAYTNEDSSNANYLADQGVITKQTIASKYRLDDKILRQEVIGMALKVKGITLPENYTCKKYFADATKNDWICRAVELAADNGIITRNNKYANPGKSITRAEALAMVMKAGNIDRSPFAGHSYYFDGNLFEDGSAIGYKNAYKFGATWQASIFYDYIRLVLENDYLLKQDPRASIYATRAEVFDFAKNITLTDLPKLPEFGAGWMEILPEQLPCFETEMEVGPGDFVCGSDWYKTSLVTYESFLTALRAKDNAKIVKYGIALGAYSHGFGEVKYRVSGDSFFSMTFGPQDWGSVLFSVYTVRNNTIIRQVFSNSDIDYKKWESAIVEKFGENILSTMGTLSETKRKEIVDFGNQYWYDRFTNMEIK